MESATRKIVCDPEVKRLKEKKVQMIDLDIISMKCIEEAFCETFVSLEERGGGAPKSI